MSSSYLDASVSKLALSRGITVVLTGGPSVGKSTIAERLGRIGFTIEEETASELIQACKSFLAAQGLGEPSNAPAIVKICTENGFYHPLVDYPAFQKQLCVLQIAKEKPHAERTSKKLVALDRGMPDNIEYGVYYNSPVPEEFSKLSPPPAERYDLCFVLESFNKFVDNGIRVEKLELGADFAKVIGPRIAGCYKSLGVTVIEVPAFIHDDAEVSIKERLDFIWQHICAYAAKEVARLEAA